MATGRSLWSMMSRVKARPIQPLTRRSLKSSGDITVTLLTTSIASTFGILIVVEQVGVYLPICLSIAMVIAVLSGLCLSEISTYHAEGCQSVYNCLYQSGCEVIAYAVGWIWLLSLTTLFAVSSKFLSNTIDSIANLQITQFIQKNAPPSCGDIFTFLVVVVIAVTFCTGLYYTRLWSLVVLPSAFLGTVVIVSVAVIKSDKSEWMAWKQIYSNLELEQLLTGTALCTVIFLGPQSLLKLSSVQIHRTSAKFLGFWNIVCYIITIVCGSLLIIVDYFPKNKDLFQNGPLLFATLSLVPAWVLAVENCSPTVAVIQDMANDGLLPRSLSKKFTFLCQKIPTCRVFVLLTVIAILLLFTLSFENLLKLAAASTLFINVIVALSILFQRYQNKDAWQYEPMLQNGAAAHYHSRKKSTEFLPRSDLPSTSATTELSGSESDNSETDIDDLVQEYKDQLQLSNFQRSDSSLTSGWVQEPTSSSSFRAKLLISVHSLNSIIFAVSVVVATKTDTISETAVICVLTTTLLLSLLWLGLLYRLPQNVRAAQIPLVPWIPGLAITLSTCPLVYVILDVWHVLLSWIILGIFHYLVYGMRNSTAASTFYGISHSAQLALKPFPLQKNICHVVQPEKRSRQRATQ